MWIHEAVQEALKTNKGIYRRNDRWPKGVWVLPTQTCLHLVLVTPNFKCRKCWEPSVDDIIADDWQVK